jgi:predicted nucleotidyltransferase component of viral defense system
MIFRPFYPIGIGVAGADLDPFRLVFGGGTALCRVHRLIQRMSEDIDLKIVADVDPARTQLRQLRGRVADALLTAGFQFDPKNSAYLQSRNENRYSVFRIPYAPKSEGVGVLRPEIQIEITLSPLYGNPVYLPLRSFISDAFDRPAEVSSLACVSIVRTIAEKFVALTRRTAVEIADAGGKRDSSLVRHVYYLHVTRAHYDSKEVAQLVTSIMEQDAAEFGNQFPAYRDDPLAETRRAISALGDDPGYANRYATFERDMIYGEKLAYSECLTTLNEIADRLG